MEKLESKLAEYADSDYYRFHMPGHKGNSDRQAYRLDITEIDGFDNLHHAEGILRKRMDYAAQIYGTEKTYFLVNGSTCGILAAVSAATEIGDTILAARNSHKAVFNAIYLKMLKTQYIYPQFVDGFWINGGINPKNVEKALNSQTNIRAIFITSPTYEGVVSDVETIAEIAHRHKVPLIVDEAHGAHFSRYDEFPKSAIECGADVVIQSLHKTMNSMTQTALLHICKNSLINRDKIERYLSIYQTSSPSYILMSSIDNCIEEIDHKGADMFSEYSDRLDVFYEKMKILRHLQIVNDDIIGRYSVYDRDKGKIVISCAQTKQNGKWLYDKLRTGYHIQPEMASGDYVICMSSYMDTPEGFDRLAGALMKIDESIGTEKAENRDFEEYGYQPAVICDTIYNAIEYEKWEKMLLYKAVGKISAEFAYIYPPGIPIIAPGEMITDRVVNIIQNYRDNGLEINGLKDEEANNIMVLCR